MSLAQVHSATTKVNPIYLNEVKDWKELKAIDSFFVKYQKITPKEALSNALELKDLIKNLKDSVQPERFNTPSLNARINILLNEALRLADLTEISAIQAAAVNEQVDKTIAAFSNINIKINTVVAKFNFENQVTIKVGFIGLDTTRLDQVSKRTLGLRKNELKVTKMPLQKDISKKADVASTNDRNRTFSQGGFVKKIDRKQDSIIEAQFLKNKARSKDVTKKGIQE